jgi:exodeoxyribonuclease V beta subunit
MIRRVSKPLEVHDLPESGHVVIEASAGTGKTFTLEHLLIDLMIRNRCPLDKILVMTFTELATQELKRRVRTKLEEVVRGETADMGPPYWEVDEETVQFLKDELEGFSRASIFTIHGFCRRLLTEHTFLLRRLFDEEHVSTESLFSTAFEEAIRTRFTQDPSLSSYLKIWLSTDHHDPLSQLREDLTKLMRESAVLRPHFDPALIARTRDAVSALGEEDVDDYCQSIQGALGRFDAKPIVDAARGVYRATRDPASSDLAHFLCLCTPWVEGLIVNEGNYWDNRWERSRAPDNPSIRLNSQRYAEGPFASIHTLLRALVPLRVAVVQQLLEPMRTLFEETLARGYYDYDGMLYGVWRKLSGPTDPGAEYLRTKLRERYQHVLIDEFQDTDKVQWWIFRSIFFDERSQSRLFVIGDPKQAIYGFRGADVGAYLEATRKIVTASGNPPVRLRRNFRSTASLISALHQIFEPTADNALFSGPITYDNTVTCGRPERQAESADGQPLCPVGLVWIKGRKKSIYVNQIRETYGRWIARKIAQLLSPDKGLTITDGEKKTALRPGDIYVLTRSISEAHRVGGFLRVEGIPFGFYKEEGLFQTQEAHNVLDLLRGVLQPHKKSRRLKAWATPFFALPHVDLPRLAELEETHPLYARLLAFQDLAIARRFETLFADILHESGLLRREIFLNDLPREATNYRHLAEWLLEESQRHRMDLEGLIAALERLVEKKPSALMDQSGIQRLPDADQAVQIMTIHKSKGLQAEVVFVFGGFASPPPPWLHACHWKRTPIKYMGVPRNHLAREAVAEEGRGEDERLLYVALTRARCQLYLPLFAPVDGRRQFNSLNGMYALVHERLLSIFRQPEEDRHHFEVHEAWVEEGSFLDEASPRWERLKDWNPDSGVPDLLDPSARVKAVRPPPRIVTSYSRIKNAKDQRNGQSFEERPFVQQTHLPKDESELPGGKEVGVFLHDLLEALDWSQAQDKTKEDWQEEPATVQIIEELAFEHGIDRVYLPSTYSMLYDALTAELHLDESATLSGLCQLENMTRELEFFFPIPESDHPALTLPTTENLEIRRGYVRGFIDLVFRHEGKTYFVDYKSDTLAAYDPDALQSHVEGHYAIQAQLYSVAILKAIGIVDEVDYDARFGGYVYLFLRGVSTAGHGLYHHRPTFSELTRYFEELVEERFL